MALMKRTMQKSIIQDQLAIYLKLSKQEKTAVILSVCQVTGMHPKAVIRAFGREQLRSSVRVPPKLGRPKYYMAETESALDFVWEQYDYPAAERLHPCIAEAVRIFTRDAMWDYSDEATTQLKAMSLGAMKVRCVTLAKKRNLCRGIGTTHASAILRSVPIFFGSWQEKSVGHGQVDSVVHSGPKLMGTMAYTVNYVDVATYWQEPVAQLNKGESATTTSLAIIQKRLPFPLAGLHPDSGSEFINLVGKQWREEEHIELTRSRPHKKNDNCYIEQRNLVVVRKYIGYGRYDCPEAVACLNELYATLRLYLNFFQPTFKLVEKKKVVSNDGKQITKKYRRVYDTTRTPYQRVLACKDVGQKAKDTLTKQYETLNPKVLRDTIQALTKKLERTQKELGYHY
jgi:hypothetical protein